jgi:hypothetical protein
VGSFQQLVCSDPAGGLLGFLVQLNVIMGGKVCEWNAGIIDRRLVDQVDRRFGAKTVSQAGIIRRQVGQIEWRRFLSHVDFRY